MVEQSIIISILQLYTDHTTDLMFSEISCHLCQKLLFQMLKTLFACCIEDVIYYILYPCYLWNCPVVPDRLVRDGRLWSTGGSSSPQLGSQDALLPAHSQPCPFHILPRLRRYSPTGWSVGGIIFLFLMLFFVSIVLLSMIRSYQEVFSICLCPVSLL